jgi:hypothetical protein
MLTTGAGGSIALPCILSGTNFSDHPQENKDSNLDQDCGSKGGDGKEGINWRQKHGLPRSFCEAPAPESKCTRKRKVSIPKLAQCSCGAERVPLAEAALPPLTFHVPQRYASMTVAEA